MKLSTQEKVTIAKTSTEAHSWPSPTMPFARRHQEAGSIWIPEQDPSTRERHISTIHRERRSVPTSFDVEENLRTTDKDRGQSRPHKPSGRPRTDDSQNPILTAVSNKVMFPYLIAPPLSDYC